jgi:hypothetical protein
LLEVPIGEEPERAAFSSAWPFSFSGLLAAVFELFELLTRKPPETLPMPTDPVQRTDGPSVGSRV